MPLHELGRYTKEWRNWETQYECRNHQAMTRRDDNPSRFESGFLHKAMAEAKRSRIID